MAEGEHRSAIASAVESQRRRVWALCYRMTGNRADADDLSQEALGRALERDDQRRAEDATGWLLAVATRVCLDHLRKSKVRRRLTELVDPLEEPDWPGPLERISPENELVREEDLRFAIAVALQKLSARQRAALILRDVCAQSLSDVAQALSTNENAVKALLVRGRQALREARGHGDVDVPANAEVVARFARAIQVGSLEELNALLAEDVWGLVNGGGVVVTARKPTFGRRTVAKQWANAKRKQAQPVDTRLLSVNGETAVLISLRSSPRALVALVHLETRAGLVAALRVLRDPKRLARLIAEVPGEANGPAT
jgi:RNA polymerase sigma-70 factor, ECF subfamily